MVLLVYIDFLTSEFAAGFRQKTPGLRRAGAGNEVTPPDRKTDGATIEGRRVPSLRYGKLRHANSPK